MTQQPDTIPAFPLTWPMNHPRAKHRRSAAFGKRKAKDGYGMRPITIAEAVKELGEQVRLIGGKRLTISTNLELRPRDGLPYSQQRKPNDPGAAVYFFRNDKPFVLACDAWDIVEHNIYAISMHLEALRGQERWGVGSLEQSLSGYELPSSECVRAWWEVLGVSRDASAEQIGDAYRNLVRQHHPDKGGDERRMAEINAAYAESKTRGL
jgi:DnaJ domain